DAREVDPSYGRSRRDLPASGHGTSAAPYAAAVAADAPVPWERFGDQDAPGALLILGERADEHEPDAYGYDTKTEPDVDLPAPPAAPRTIEAWVRARLPVQSGTMLTTPTWTLRIDPVDPNDDLSGPPFCFEGATTAADALCSDAGPDD